MEKHRKISHSLDYYDQYQRKSNLHSTTKNGPSDEFVLASVVLFLLFVVGVVAIGM